jgi:NADH pyrophosphatase NudC (nudix superfamily)
MIFNRATLYKIGYPIMKLYWFFRRPTTVGVRCIVTHQNKILLIRHTYGSNLLTTVGGGVEKNESLEQTVIRETKEEVGLSLKDIRQIDSVPYTKEFKKDTIHVFVAEAVNDRIVIDPNEIQEAGWHEKENLPEDISPLFRKFYNLTFSHSKPF